jgi:hypothetical protein
VKAVRKVEQERYSDREDEQEGLRVRHS